MDSFTTTHICSQPLSLWNLLSFLVIVEEHSKPRSGLSSCFAIILSMVKLSAVEYCSVSFRSRLLPGGLAVFDVPLKKKKKLKEKERGRKSRKSSQCRRLEHSFYQWFIDQWFIDKMAAEFRKHLTTCGCFLKLRHGLPVPEFSFVASKVLSESTRDAHTSSHRMSSSTFSGGGDLAT